MSTSHALLHLVEEITPSIDAAKISIGVFIDQNSPAAKGCNPKISDIVFFSLDYSSLRCI